ncbi:MAG: carbohydrate ABC transporter permease, partial [Campylobacteraceae bacterium]|nr:carbohydrate ABC transporter permease [Campylobacteraceae bacterium]
MIGSASEKIVSQLSRVFIYLILFVCAVYFLLPIFVMIITSLKSIEEIKNGNLLALPEMITFQPWIEAWSEARIGPSTEGI